MKVLVAEDDFSIREVVKLILSNEGVTVLEAEDALTTLKLSEDERPDIILLDISLGSSDGGKVSQQLKKNQATKHIPLIIMSANTKTREIANSSGADGFLLKPFDINDLLSLIKQYA